MDPTVTLGDMIAEVYAPGFVIGLVRLIIIAGVLILLSRLWNKFTGDGFDDWMQAAKLDNGLGGLVARGIYYGFKLLTLGIVATSIFGAVLMAALLVNPSPARAAPLSDTTYDAQIKDAAFAYWPYGPDWLWWKAQLFQESRLEPDAISPAGARGIAQFMPATWRETIARMGIDGVSPFDAKYAIRAGALYMVMVKLGWTPDIAPPSVMELHRFAQAGYNAGGGNIRKAQRRCGMAKTWELVAPCLVQITGPRHSLETRTYIDRIAKWRAMLGGFSS